MNSRDIIHKIMSDTKCSFEEADKQADYLLELRETMIDGHQISGIVFDSMLADMLDGMPDDEMQDKYVKPFYPRKGSDLDLDNICPHCGASS